MLGLDPRLGAESRWRTLAGVAVIVGLVAILFDSAYHALDHAVERRLAHRRPAAM